MGILRKVVKGPLFDTLFLTHFCCQGCFSGVLSKTGQKVVKKCRFLTTFRPLFDLKIGPVLRAFMAKSRTFSGPEEVKKVSKNDTFLTLFGPSSATSSQISHPGPFGSENGSKRGPKKTRFFEVWLKSTLSAASNGPDPQKRVRIRTSKMTTYGCPGSRNRAFPRFTFISDPGV